MNEAVFDTVGAICNALTRWPTGDYNPFEFYREINGRNEEANEIARAMDAGTNEDVINAVWRCLHSYCSPGDPTLYHLLKMIQISWI